MFGRKRSAIDKPEGFIYIATNQSMPGVVKIGMTHKAPGKRLAELYTTGVPSPFVLEYQCRVPDRRSAERFLHNHFSAARVTKNREFFAVSAIDAIKVTRSRVANKKLNYTEPVSNLNRLLVVCLLIMAVGAGILYQTGGTVGENVSVMPQLRHYIDKLLPG